MRDDPKQGYAAVGKPPFHFERWLYSTLSTKWCGNEMVPLHHDTLHFDDHGAERVAMFLNDSFEIGIGYTEQWSIMLRREAFHRLMWWYLKRWSWGEWFGLRRWVYYKLLSRRVREYRQGAPL